MGKLNFGKTYPEGGVGEAKLLGRRFPKMWNFAKTYLQSKVVEADLLEDISPRAELWKFTKSNLQSRVAEICKDIA